MFPEFLGSAVGFEVGKEAQLGTFANIADVQTEKESLLVCSYVPALEVDQENLWFHIAAHKPRIYSVVSG